MNKNDYHILTVKYLRNELEESEKKEYEKLLQRDKSLRRIYFQLKNTRAALANKDKVLFQNKLAEAEKRYFKKKASIAYLDKPGYLYGSIAAAVLLLLSIGAFLLLFNNQPSNDELFNKYYVSYTEVVEARSGEATIDTLISALQAYKQKNYQNAIRQFEPLLDQQFKNIASFYIGLSYLELNNAGESIEYLARVSNSESDYRQEAQWYLTLAYLRNNERDKALIALNRILDNTSHYYYQKARRLYDELG